MILTKTYETVTKEEAGKAVAVFRRYFLSDVANQTERLMENISVLLQEAGASVADIMQAIVYLRDPADYEEVNRYIRTHHPDMPHLIVLAPVCRPGWLIETECIAVIPADLPQYPCL